MSEEYGRHLQKVVEHVRVLPECEQPLPVYATPIDKPTDHDAPVDCRGVPIKVGNGVVVAGASGRLYVYTVKRIERPGHPTWWVRIRFEGGGWTTPDRCAVVSVS